tara:strand:+ start:4505 stop:4999 length:495 start_codon:yes stop_codon:yes gene_type:complete
MFKNKINIKKIDIYSFAIVSVIFVIDRLSKIYIVDLIQTHEKEIFVNDFLNLTLNWNTGIAFGLLSSNANLFYHLVSALILLIIIYLIYLMVLSDNFGKIILSLIIGGALGNLYDRLNYFAVPDFIDFHIQTFHWFTFNLADIFISLGIIIMLFKEISSKKKNN